MGEVVIGGCLGHSDHKVVDFQIIGNRRNTTSETSTLDMGRVDFRLVKDLASKVPWETVFEDIGSMNASHFLRAIS